MDDAQHVWQAGSSLLQQGEELVGVAVYAIAKGVDEEHVVRPMLVGPPNAGEELTKHVKAYLCGPSAEPAPSPRPPAGYL